MLDNVTAVTYINKMGGTHSVPADKVAREIWSWAVQRDIWLTAAYVSGDKNHIADFKSRHFHDNTDWTLHPTVFSSITNTFFYPEIDLFASRLNKQVDRFVSWKPEPGAWAVDAFHLSWKPLTFYAFPPFSLIGQVLRKVLQEEAEGILVVPLWTTQPWSPPPPPPTPPSASHRSPTDCLTTETPAVLTREVRCDNPLHHMLTIMVVLLSGQPYRNLGYLQQLKTLPVPHGEKGHRANIAHPSKVGDHFVLHKKLIPILPL